MKFNTAEEVSLENNEIYKSTINRKPVKGSESYLKLLYCMKYTLKTNRDLFNYFKQKYCHSKDPNIAAAKRKYVSMIKSIYDQDNQQFEKFFADDCKDIKMAKNLLREAIEENNIFIISFILDIFIKTTEKDKDKEIKRLKFISSLADILCKSDSGVINLIVNKIKIPSIDIYIKVIKGKLPVDILPSADSGFKYFIRGVSSITVLENLEQNYSAEIDKYLKVMILYPINENNRMLLDYYLQRLKKFPKKLKEEVFINMYCACRDLATYKYVLEKQKEFNIEINTNKFKLSNFVSPLIYHLLTDK